MRKPENNLERFVAGWVCGLARGDFDTLSEPLDPEMVWQGIREELVCNGREEVLEQLRDELERLPRVEALEVIAGQDSVVLGAKSPDLTRSAKYRSRAGCSTCSTSAKVASFARRTTSTARTPCGPRERRAGLPLSELGRRASLAQASPARVRSARALRGASAASTGKNTGHPIWSSRRRIQFDTTVISQLGWPRPAATSIVTP